MRVLLAFRKVVIFAVTAASVAAIAAVVYGTALRMSLPPNWTLARFESTGMIVAMAFGAVAGVVTCQPFAVTVGACLGLLAAATELETHSDVSIGTLLAFETALETQSRWVFPVVATLGASAFVSDWFWKRFHQARRFRMSS
jgi:hypothetical protein